MKISVIIPVFNEKSDTVRHLISEIKKSPQIHEVILVNDASDQNLSKKYKQIIGIDRLIDHPINKGKTSAIKSGFEKSTGDHILVMDGDLKGITTNHISALSKLGENYDVICLIKSGDNIFFKSIGSSYITRGDHLIKREVIEKYKNELFDNNRWGFDNNINYLILNRPVSFIFAEMMGSTHTLKSKKYNLVDGFSLDAKMVYEVMVKKYEVVDWFKIYYKILPFIKKRKMLKP